MALVVKDRVKETTTTTGTGTITLAGAVTGFQAFSAIGNANTTYYTISSNGGSEWEVGIGTYTLVGTTLARTTVLASSNAGALVNFSAGTKDVYCVYPAGKMVSTDLGSATNVSGTVAIANGGTGATTANAGLNNLQGYTTTATAAGTTTLTASSSYKQYFTGTTTQTVVMPDVTTLALGRSYEIVNNSTGTLTVNSSGANLITTIPAGISGVVTCIAITGTTAASWHYEYSSFDSITGTGANVFATSPTLVTPILGTPQSGNFSTGTFTWPTFNQSTTGSAATLATGRTIGMTGDVTWTSASFNGSANVTGTSTLANSGVTAGTYMSPKVTVDAKGRVTSAATAVFTSSDYFVQFTQTTNGWDVTRYVFPIPSWYYIETNNLGNLSTSISYPTNFTSSPSGMTGGMVVGAYSNGMGYYPNGSGWSPGMSWDGTTQSNYYSQYYNWGMINPSPLTVYAPNAPTQGFTFIYLQYPSASGNTYAQDFFGSISMGFSSSVGSSFAVASPPLSGSSRRAYAVLMIDGNVGTVTCSLTGSTVVYAYNSYANKTYVFCEVTDNTSVGTIVGGSTWLTWGSSANYWGHAWADYT